MRNYRRAHLLFIVLCAVIGSSALSPQQGRPACWEVLPEKIIIYEGGTATEVPVEGEILQVSAGDGGVYYLVGPVEGREGLRAGFAGGDPVEKRFEKSLPEPFAGGAVRKFHVAGMVASILVVPVPEEQAGSLYRVDLNDMRVLGDAIPDIADFLIDGDDTIFLVRKEKGLSVSMGERSVLLSLESGGPCFIRAFLDRRVAVVTVGEEAEMIDLLAGKSIYQYHPGRDFLPPGEFNFEITVFDDVETESIVRDMLFYKVFINGVESGRTDTGPAGLERSFRTLLEAGGEYLITLERWVLNQARGRYERANNVLQPKTQRVSMPLNRIILMRVRFDGNAYHFSLLPHYK